MNDPLVLLHIAVAMLITTHAIPLHAEDAAQTVPTGRHVPGDPKTPDLRQPGFVFMELNTPRVEEYVAYLEKVTDFKAVYRKPRYVEMETGSAQLTVMDPALLPKGHPFYDPPPGGRRGYGIEIGLVVADIEKAFAAAAEFKDKGFPISAGIGMRPWGVRDFRVLTSDGYYFRFTEGHKPGA
jgi:glyoxalase/bleomycin resistance protein/dioxygenase superfamily protein